MNFVSPDVPNQPADDITSFNRIYINPAPPASLSGFKYPKSLSRWYPEDHDTDTLIINKQIGTIVIINDVFFPSLLHQSITNTIVI